MIGNLFLKFKTCPFIDCTFKLYNSKAHESCLTIKTEKEEDITDYLYDNIEDIIRESKCIDLKDNEYIYDLEYKFERFDDYYGQDNEDVDFDFNFFKNESCSI